MHHYNRPYPVDALTNELQAFIYQLCSVTEAPPELVGPVVLSAMSAAVQGTIDVKSANRKAMPTSLFFGVVVPSGGRKSSVLQHVTPAFEQFEQSHLDADGKLLLETATEAGLVDLFNGGARSFFFALSEGGQLLKGLDCPAFCKRFDGASIRHTTRKHGSILVSNTRSTICMLTQATTFSRHMNKNGDFLIESGFLPRMLMSFPKTTVPTPNRGYQPSPTVYLSEPSSNPFHSRVAELLDNYSEWLAKGQPERMTLELSREANCQWEDFYQHTLARLNPPSHQCDWKELDAFVKRAGEQARRLAAVLQWFSSPSEQIHPQAMHAAIRIVMWHLEEAKFAFGEPSIQIKGRQWAETLYQYLYQQYQALGYANPFTKGELLRCAPSTIRQADRLNIAIHNLARDQRVGVWSEGKKQLIMLSPGYSAPINFNPWQTIHSQQA
jgi:hypothetical protein